MSEIKTCRDCGYQMSSVKRRYTEYIFEGRRFGDEKMGGAKDLCPKCFSRNYRDAIAIDYQHRLAEYRALSPDEISQMNIEYEASSRNKCLNIFYVVLSMIVFFSIFFQIYASERTFGGILTTVVLGLTLIAVVVLKFVLPQSEVLIARIARALLEGTKFFLALLLCALILHFLLDFEFTSTMSSVVLAATYVVTGILEFLGMLAPKVRPPKKPKAMAGSSIMDSISDYPA